MAVPIDWSAVTRGMSEWALEAQDEHNALMEKEAKKLSNVPTEVEDCGWWNWVSGICTGISEREAFWNNHDTAWIIVKVDGFTTTLNTSQTYEEKLDRLQKFIEFAESKQMRNAAPTLSANWRAKVPVPDAVVSFLPGVTLDWKKGAAFAGTTLATVTLLSLIDKQKGRGDGIIPRRRNEPITLTVLGIGLTVKAAIGLVAAVSAVTLAGGLTAAHYYRQSGHISLVDAQNVKSRAKSLIERVQAGEVYQGQGSKNIILNMAGYSNSLSVCAPADKPEIARDQTAFFMALTGYITGDSSLGNRADQLMQGNTGFRTAQESEASMRSFLHEMETSSDARVRDVALQYALISRKRCMEETARGEKILTTGGSSCPTVTPVEFAFETLNGLFFLSSPRRPCRMPSTKWKRIQLMTYAPLGLGVFYLTFPLIKGGIAVGGKLLEKAAEDE